MDAVGQSLALNKEPKPVLSYDNMVAQPQQTVPPCKPAPGNCGLTQDRCSPRSPEHVTSHTNISPSSTLTKTVRSVLRLPPRLAIRGKVSLLQSFVSDF